LKYQAKKIFRKTYNKFSLNLMKAAVQNLLMPVAYTRTREIPEVIDISGILNEKRNKLRILDISSPQLLSLSLAYHNPKWEILYLNPFDDEILDMKQRINVLKLKNIKTIQEDIKNQDLKNKIGSFDYIFSSSVFEHIYPENGGDIEASKIIKSLLNTTGIFTISVPFYKKFFHEYTYKNVYYIDNKRNEKIFFQRFYDEETLRNQIIIPTGLKLIDQTYIGERFFFKNNIHKRLGTILGSGKFGFIFGRFFNLISKIFMLKSKTPVGLSKPYLAFLKFKNDA